MRLVLAPVALAVIACASAPRRGEELAESLRTYHEGVRWQRFAVAASRIPPAERDQFVEERDQLADDLRISDYELIRLRRSDEHRAEVQVKYTWYRESEGRVRETHAVQQWEQHGEVWWLVGEHRLRGEPMPGLLEEADEPEEPLPRATPEGPPGPETPPAPANGTTAPQPVNGEPLLE